MLFVCWDLLVILKRFASVEQTIRFKIKKCININTGNSQCNTQNIYTSHLNYMLKSFFFFEYALLTFVYWPFRNGWLLWECLFSHGPTNWYQKQGIMSFEFSINSLAFASKFQENLEEMFPWYCNI